MKPLFLFCLAAAALNADGQVIGAGYTAPNAVVFGAPGQVIALFVRNLTTRLKQPVVATSTPLPRSFGGISVTLTQNVAPTNVQAPLFSVSQYDACQVSLRNPAS